MSRNQIFLYGSVFQNFLNLLNIYASYVTLKNILKLYIYNY